MSASAHPLPAASQRWDAGRYAANADFVPALGQGVADLLAPRAGERILDLGCGDGVLSEKLAASGATIVGADASPELVAAARARGVDAHVVDGHSLPYDGEFDAVFSNAALHWMRRPEDVLRGVRRALRAGGRFVAEMGGHGNVAAITTALRAAIRLHGHADPTFRWYFPTADGYARLLRSHGFQVESIALLPRPTPFPTDMAGWLQTFADPWLAGIDAGQRAPVIDTTVALLAPALRDENGAWTGDYVRLRFHATAV